MKNLIFLLLAVCFSANGSLLKQSTARKISFFMTDSTDHVSAKTGLTVTCTLSKDGGSFGASGGSITEVSSGWYYLAANTTDTGTLGDLDLHCTSAGADATDLRAEVVTDLPGATVASVTGAVGSVTGAVGSVTGAVGSVTGNVGGNVVGSVASVTAGVTVTTNNDKTGYTASTVSDKTGYALTAAYDPAKTASQAGDAMSLTTLQSPVMKSGTASAGAASTITLAGAVATDSFYNGMPVKIYGGTGAGQTRTIVGYVGATKVATVDTAWATNPDNTSTFAVLASEGPKIDSSQQVTAASVQGNVTGSVASVTGTVGSVTGSVGSVTGSVGSVTGAVGSVTGNVGGNVVGSVASVSGAVGSVTGAVGSVTGNVGGNVVGSVASVTAAVSADLTKILGTTLTETSGQIAGGFKQFFNIASPTSTMNTITAVTTATNLTTNNDKTGYTVSTNNDKTGYSLTSAYDPAKTAAQAGDAMTLTSLYSPIHQSGTAQAGAAGTITLASGASATDSLYKGLVIRIYGGTGAGQSRVITGYVGSTKVATVDWNWTTNPDNTSTYSVLAIAAPKLDSAQQVTASSVQGNVTGSVGSVTGSVGSVTGAVGSVTGAVGSVTAGVTVTTNNDKTGYTASTVSDKTGYSLSGAGAGAIWDVTLASHLTSGTTGAALNAAGSAGDPWATAIPGAYGAGTAGNIVGNNLNATVSSRLATAGYTAPDNTTITNIYSRLGAPAGASVSADVAAVKVDTAAIKAKTDNLPASPAAVGSAMTLTSGERTSTAGVVWDSLTSGMSTAGSIGVLLKTDVDATVSSRLATSGYTAPSNSNITAIKAVTDLFGFTSGNVNANAQVVSDKTGYTLAANQIPIKKNTALANFQFPIIGTVTGNLTAGLTVSCQRAIDGGSFANCANSVVEIGSGYYRINFAASDLNGDTVVVRFYGTGVREKSITLVTQ